MTITVKKKHETTGVRFSNDRCPLALAAEDAGLKDVRVSRLYLTFATPVGRVGVEMDGDMQQYKHSFDFQNETKDREDLHGSVPLKHKFKLSLKKLIVFKGKVKKDQYRSTQQRVYKYQTRSHYKNLA